MMAEQSSGRGCFKIGCIGCAGIFLLALIGGAVVTGIAYMQAGNADVVSETRERSVARPAAVEETAAPPATAGRVILDLDETAVFIKPGEPGSSVVVKAAYDKSTYTLEETFEEDTGDGWTYRVRLAGHGSTWMRMLRSIFSGSQERVDILLPPDVPIALELRLDSAGAEVDLGGLWLTEVDVDATRAGAEIDVSRPTREPVRSFSVSASMAGANIIRLGNASPRTLALEAQMGGLDVDLTGQWLADSEVRITSRMGGTQLRLPRDVVIRGLEGDRGVAQREEVPLPVLTFDVSVEDGGLEIRD